uniref:IGF2 antisense RNA n=2 Tax=Pan TaxID=9596 RepID=H2Q2W6_PANTR
MSKRKWRGFRGAQPERARPPAASPQPCPAPHAGLPGGSRRRAPAPAGQQQMRAESRSGAQRRRGSARRGAHREAGGCVRGRTRSSGSGRSNALWRAVDAAEALALSSPLRRRWDQAQHFTNPAPFSKGPQSAPPSPPAGRRRRGVDLALAPLAGEGHTRWRQPGRPGKSD